MWNFLNIHYEKQTTNDRMKRKRQSSRKNYIYCTQISSFKNKFRAAANKNTAYTRILKNKKLNGTKETLYGEK